MVQMNALKDGSGMSRKNTIIESAMKLFAHKGYHGTSMQEIADNSGIAKASLYNHFKSKEDIAISIFKYHYEILFKKVSEIGKEPGLSPKERFTKQLTFQLKQFYEHRDFIQMRMGEQVIKVNDELNDVIFNIRSATLNWYSSQIRAIYGERINPHAIDCAAMLNGIIKEYLFFVIMDEKEIDLEYMAPYLIKRLDAMVESYSSKERPLLHEELMQEFMKEPRTKAELLAEMNDEFNRLKEEAERSVLSESHRQQLLSSIGALQEELSSQNEQPKKIVIDALLLMIQTQQTNEMAKGTDRLKTLIDHYLSS
jgi:AcrR family transcriptional regulator